MVLAYPICNTRSQLERCTEQGESPVGEGQMGLPGFLSSARWISRMKLGGTNFQL